MSVSSEITRLENAKTAIKTAIKGKGVAVPDETKVDGLATLIDDIFSPEVQEKSVVPSKTAQTVTPDSGKLLSKVSVAAITNTLLASLDCSFCIFKSCNFARYAHRVSPPLYRCQCSLYIICERNSTTSSVSGRYCIGSNS